MTIQVMEQKKLHTKSKIMKSLAVLIFTIMLFVGNLANAQNQKIWFDADWKVVSQDKASYYRPVPQEKKDGYWIVDYYTNGKIQKEGFSYLSNTIEPIFEGLVKIYYETGILKSESFYVKGIKDGRFSAYFDTGELQERGDYANNLRDGNWKTYYKNGKIKERGKYEKGEKIGIWKTFYKNVYK